ncbi:hypothetical protein N9829_01340 [Gammaproteobacteria bacterium]|nr:hypothetical protein [Gammaproteobacteria bacterium]
MKISKKIYYILISAILISSCNSMPPLDMTLSSIPDVTRQSVELKSITVGYIAKTRGVKLDTNHLVPPAWETALRDAINRSLVFQDDVDRNITISVRINHFDIPAAGFAMTSDCGAIYEIMDRSNGKIIFSTDVRSSGTTPMDYAFMGVTRVQESMNRCARTNIAGFLNELNKVVL